MACLAKHIRPSHRIPPRTAFQRFTMMSSACRRSAGLVLLAATLGSWPAHVPLPPAPAGQSGRGVSALVEGRRVQEGAGPHRRPVGPDRQDLQGTTTGSGRKPMDELNRLEAELSTLIEDERPIESGHRQGRSGREHARANEQDAHADALRMRRVLTRDAAPTFDSVCAATSMQAERQSRESGTERSSRAARTTPRRDRRSNSQLALRTSCLATTSEETRN